MDPKYEKWTKWIDIIYWEVVNLVNKRQCFRELQDVIRQNPNIQKPCSFWTFCDHAYIAYSVMACRRQIKAQKDSISLKGLLEEIIETPHAMSRECYINLYPEDIRDEADQILARCFLGECKDHIDPIIVQRDLCELKSHGGNSGKLEEFADRVFAHRDKRESKIPTFKELDDCIDTLEKLTRKYRLLIKALDAGESLIIKSIEDYSKEIFCQPWILSDHGV